MKMKMRVLVSLLCKVGKNFTPHKLQQKFTKNIIYLLSTVSCWLLLCCYCIHYCCCLFTLLSGGKWYGWKVSCWLLLLTKCCGKVGKGSLLPTGWCATPPVVVLVCGGGWYCDKIGAVVEYCSVDIGGSCCWVGVGWGRRWGWGEIWEVGLGGIYKSVNWSEEKLGMFALRPSKNRPMERALCWRHAHKGSWAAPLKQLRNLYEDLGRFSALQGPWPSDFKGRPIQ